MEREPDHVPCEATVCKHYKDYAKGCCYVTIKLNRSGRCKSFERKFPYPTMKKRR
jgi:hypothetical protein